MRIRTASRWTVIRTECCEEEGGHSSEIITLLHQGPPLACYLKQDLRLVARDGKNVTKRPLLDPLVVNDSNMWP